MPLLALWLLLQFCLTAGHSTLDHLRGQLKDFHVVSGPLRHCNNDDPFPRQLNYSFAAFNRTFNLELTRTSSFLASGYTHKVVNEQDEEVVDTARDCYYHGVVSGDYTSHVAVSTCSGGLRGSVVGNGYDFYLEPLFDDKPQTKGRSLMESPQHAVYRMEDHIKTFSCGSKGSYPLHLHDEKQHVHVSSSFVNSTSHHRHLMQQNTPIFTPSRGNNVPPMWVEMMVINDQARVRGGNQPGALKTEDIVFQMDALFRRNTAFSPPIRLRLVAQESWPTGNKFDYTVTANGEIDQGNLLRDLLRWRYDHLAELPSHDILVLMTGESFIGSVSGLAYEQVMCTPTKSGAVTEMTKTLSMNAAIAAHEVGHTLGMSHDGTGNLCPVSGFVMASVLMLGSSPDKWSTCSADAMSRFFTMFSPKCMSIDPPSQGTPPPEMCGDGFLGGNEQCDCGSTDCSASDPCCNGATCRFKTGAECSAQAPCCSQCKIVSSATRTKCSSPKNDCQFAQYCDGYSAQCPTVQFANVGAPCSVAAIPPQVGMLEGKCYRGECWSHTLQCQQERFDTGCVSPNAAMMVQDKPNIDADCGVAWCIVAKQKICTLLAGEDGLKYKNDGVPCGTGAKQCYQGRCINSYLLPGGVAPPGYKPDPPVNACLGQTCSGHGFCVGTSGTCSCSPEWTGRYCNLAVLPPASAPTERRPIPFFPLTFPPTVPTPPSPPPTRFPTPLPTFPPTLPPTVPPTKFPTRPPSFPPSPRPTFPPSPPPSLKVIPFSPTAAPPSLPSSPTSSPPSSPPSLLDIPFAPTLPPTTDIFSPSPPSSSPPSFAPSSSPTQPATTPPTSPISPTSPPTTPPPTFFSLYAPLSAPIRSDIIATKGKPFLFNTSQHFFSPSGEALIFSQEGLPARSGLRLDPAAGFIFGTPSDADAAASPIALIISARSSGGRTALNAFLRVDSTQTPPRSLGIAPILIFDTEELNVNLADSFVDDNQDPLTFTIQGLPPGSGLQLSSSGLLTGLPSAIDVIAQPFRVTVLAEDGKGGTAEDNVLITIMSAAGSSLPGGPSPPLLIPTQCLREGVLYQQEMGPFFPNCAECRFSCAGLPSGTGLRFDVGNRILYGAPNRIDVMAAEANQNKLDITIVAADKQGRTVQQRCVLSIVSATVGFKQPVCIPTSVGLATEVVVSSSNTYYDQPPRLQQAILPALQSQPTATNKPADAPPSFITKLLPSLPAFGVRDGTVENTPPLAATIGKQSATVDFPFTLDASPYFIDREREPLSFAISGLSSSSGLVFDTSTGKLSGIPLGQAAGTVRVTITARDPGGLSVSNTFDLVINDRNKPSGTASSSPPASSPTWPAPPQWTPPSPQPDTSPWLALSPAPASSPSWPLPIWSAPSPSLTPANAPSWPLPVWSAPSTAPPTPAAIPRSAKDCQTLKWSTRKQATVCASTTDVRGQCNPATSFPLAVSTCSALGARMCTYQELASGVAVGPFASCSSFSVWWTSRLCEGGVQVFNTNQPDAGITCRAASDQLGVVCCADNPSQDISLPQPQSPTTPASQPQPPSPGGPPLNMNPIIPPRTTTVGVFQYFPLAPSFGGSDLYFSMQGLPQGTGFQLDKGSGTLFGAASVADMLASPISMLIRAASQTAGAYSQTNFVLTVLRNLTTNDPVASLIPSSSATVERPFLLDISPFFTDPQRDRLTFNVTGLPENTGFRLMPTTGIFFGAATQADLRAPQPLSVRVSAVNSRKGFAEQVLLLSILSPDTDTTTANGISGIRSRNFAPVSAIVGQPFFVDLSQHFVPAAGDSLAFSIQGLPRTTGFVVDSQAGVLYGSAINLDLLMPQPITLRVLADNKKGDTAEQPMYITIIAGSQQGCQNLNWRSFDSMPDVCATSAVKPDGSCATPTSFRVAENMCRAKNARLCTSDELMADASNDPSCPVDNARIWTSTLCPDGTVYTQAGSALYISSFLPVCTSKSAQNAFKCCADKQEAGSGNKNVHITAKAVEASDFILELSTYFTPPKPSSFLSYSLDPPFPSGSGLSLSGKGLVSGRPTQADVATVSDAIIVVTVTDSEGWSINLQLVISITPQDNQPPVLTGTLEPKVANVGTQVYFPLGSFFSDPDQDQLSFSLTNIASDSGFGIDPVSGAVFGVPTVTDLGVKSLSITVFDGKGGVCDAVLVVTVTRNNPPFSVSAIPRTIANRGQLYMCHIANYFVDPDNDKLTYAISGLPPGTGLTLDPNTGDLSGSPSLADVQSIQPLTVRVQVSDGKGAKVFENIVILARDNQAPTSQAIPLASGRERSAIFLSLSSYFQDPDGDSLTYSILGLPTGSGLLLDTSSGVLAGLPSAIDAGPQQPLNLSISVDDKRGGTATQSFQLVILNAQGSNAPVGLAPPPGGWGSSQRAPIPAYLRQSTRDIIYGVLSPVEVNAGRPMFEMLSLGFSEFGSKKVVFTQIQGLPAGTGLALSAEGVLSGIPSPADQSARQPLQLSVIAMDTMNTTEVRKTLALTVVTSRAPSAAPSPQPTAEVKVSSDLLATVLDAIVGKPMLTQIAPPKQFQTPMTQYRSFASLQSRLVGLPSGSGLSLDPISGTLSGTPNNVDLKAAGSKGLSLNVTFLLQTPLGTQLGHVPVVVKIQATPPPRSRRSCSELGWNSFEMLGICASSQPGVGGCPESMSYSAASAFCTSAGARLCTARELESDAAKGSGCDLDQQRVWSSDQCDTGAITAAGSMMPTLVQLCSAKTDRYRVRCCADEDWGLFTRQFIDDFVDDEDSAATTHEEHAKTTKGKNKNG